MVESVCVSHAWCMYVPITHQYTSLHRLPSLSCPPCFLYHPYITHPTIRRIFSFTSILKRRLIKIVSISVCVPADLLELGGGVVIGVALVVVAVVVLVGPPLVGVVLVGTTSVPVVVSVVGAIVVSVVIVAVVVSVVGPL